MTEMARSSTTKLPLAWLMLSRDTPRDIRSRPRLTLDAYQPTRILFISTLIFPKRDRILAFFTPLRIHLITNIYFFHSFTSCSVWALVHTTHQSLQLFALKLVLIDRAD